MTRFGGGRIANINYFAGVDTLPIPALAWGLAMVGRTIRGELCEGRRVRIERMLNLIRSGRVTPGRLVTHRFHGLDELETALCLTRDRPRDLTKPMVHIE